MAGKFGPMESKSEQAPAVCVRAGAELEIGSVLDTSHFAKVTGHVPRTWQQSTAEYISFLKANENELR
jgi:hypothetical protein